MERPNSNELRKFLDAYKRLESFEAQQRTVRGYGAFRNEDCPMPEAVKVIGWLTALAHDELIVSPTDQT